MDQPGKHADDQRVSLLRPSSDQQQQDHVGGSSNDHIICQLHHLRRHHQCLRHCPFYRRGTSASTEDPLSTSCATRTKLSMLSPMELEPNLILQPELHQLASGRMSSPKELWQPSETILLWPLWEPAYSLPLPCFPPALDARRVFVGLG